jgi:hypothetical protein
MNQGWTGGYVGATAGLGIVANRESTARPISIFVTVVAELFLLLTP